jgi:hypothetical protein
VSSDGAAAAAAMEALEGATAAAMDMELLPASTKDPKSIAALLASSKNNTTLLLASGFMFVGSSICQYSKLYAYRGLATNTSKIM